jgi:hypothetical protein
MGERIARSFDDRVRRGRVHIFIAKNDHGKKLASVMKGKPKER